LSSIINQRPNFSVCGEVQDARGAIEAIRSTKPDMAVLDVSMPGINGIELIKMILAEQPKVRILVVSMHDETHYGLRALRAGAKGYIMKTEPVGSIINALETIAAGKTHVSPSFSERLIFHVIQSKNDGYGSPVAVLTDRELEVLEKIGKGMSTREVAEDLKLSHKTVETHRAHIKEKLGFKDSTSMVRFALEWVENEESEDGREPKFDGA
jgi:DNA-binding NarL/FixJ family response regulator